MPQPPQSLTAHTIPVEDSHLFAEEAGTKNAPALILIHGNMLDRRIWDPNITALAEYARVIRYDMRGFGRSGPKSRQRGRAIDDLRRLLDHLDLDTAVICGLSMGGVTATHFTLTHPERTTGLILVDTDLSGFPISAELARPIMDTYKALEHGQQQQAVAIWLNHAMLAPTRRYPTAWAALKQIVNDYSWQDWLIGTDVLIKPPPIGRLHEITAPTLILTGSDDLARFQAIARKLAEDIPHATHTIIHHAAHLCPMEQPDRFNQLIIEFLQQHQLRRA